MMKVGAILAVTLTTKQAKIMMNINGQTILSDN